MDDIGSVKEVEVDLLFSDLKFRSQEIGIPGPLHLDIDIYNTDKSFLIKGNLTGEIILTCSRCLEKFNYPIDIELEREIEDKDIENIDDVELAEILENNIFLNIPIKPLCDKDCKGLCPECGQNLNEAECDCDTEIVDPRLAELGNFFDDDK